MQDDLLFERVLLAVPQLDGVEDAAVDGARDLKEGASARGSILSWGRGGRTRNVPSLSIDYNSLLSSDLPALPCDVTFLIAVQEEKQQGEVLAHKFIFALESSVLKSRFCGAGNFAGENGGAL